MKLDQIAYYAHNEAQVKTIKESMGLQKGEWIEDTAEGSVGTVRPEDGSWTEGRSKGHLRFNYDLGIELEILTYLDGPHWHEGKQEFRSGNSFISHIGFHMDEGEEVPARVKKLGTLVQLMDTDLHTNDYIVEKERTYHYEIYSMPFGPDLKYIWRIEA